MVPKPVQYRVLLHPLPLSGRRGSSSLQPTCLSLPPMTWVLSSVDPLPGRVQLAVGIRQEAGTAGNAMLTFDNHSLQESP